MKKIKGIVIDPGHGGHDPGALGTDSDKKVYAESDINLHIAAAAKIFVNPPDFPGVVATLTRETFDETVSLDDRCKIANTFDCPILSIHCNASEDRRAHGVEAWAFSNTNPDGSESDGFKLADAICEAIAEDAGFHNRGPKYIYDRGKGDYIFRKLAILRNTRRPAVIVECGFMSNPDDLLRLLDPLHQMLIASAIAGVVREYAGGAL